MAQRRFGPTLGAGVVVIEKEAEKLIEAAPLGVTLYVTPLEKGSTTDLISTYSKRDMLAKVGGLIDSFDGPDCAQDFWDHSNGAGELHFLRVTSALNPPRVAGLEVWSREMGSLVTEVARRLLRVDAKSGGRWAGRKRTIWRTTGLLADIGVTTLTTGLAMLTDEWVGGFVKLDGVPGKEYQIVSNTSAGVVTVQADATMSADLAAGGAPTDQGYQLILRTRIGPEGLKRVMAVEFADGEQNPTTEFSLNVFINEELVRRYPDLSMDPASIRYFVRLINDDQSNEDIFVTDLLSPSNPAPTDRRPANEAGVTTAITATTLTSRLIQHRVTVGDPNPASSVLSTTDEHKYRDVLEFEVTADGGSATISMKSLCLGGGAVVHTAVTASNTNGTNFDFSAPTSPIIPPIRLTCGTSVFNVGDKIIVEYFPFEPNGLVGGLLIPDLVNSPNTRFRIVSNTHRVITVSAGSLITDGSGAVNDRFQVIYPQELGGTDRTPGALVATNGYDGLAGLTDTDYTNVHLSTSASRSRDLLNQNKGLVKVACPDRTATAVQQAGLALAEAFNWQFRVEIPDNITTESAALAHINSTIGRNDFGVTILPSFADVPDLERPGQLKRIPMTGMIHGREALVAKNFDGYHKAAAGVDVTLPRVVKLPFANTLNEEALNPAGINVVKKVKGNFIVWGDRTIAKDPAWKFKHQRELMSHYENRLREGFDFIIFALNNVATQQQLLTTLRAFFLPEFAKGAVRGKSFEDAVGLKIDEENNTDATRAAGDLFADITLRLADTVERFIMRIGKAGVFESVQPA